MFSSSELTVPDTYETYHDVHHGYSPSFAASDSRGEIASRQSLPRSQSLVPHIEWCVFNPVAMVPSLRPPRQASFDFLSGNRAHLRENSLVDGLSGLPKTPLILPTSTFLRTAHLADSHTQKANLSLGYESESSGDVLSADGGEYIEIEELSTFDVQSTVSRDLFLKNTDGILLNRLNRRPHICCAFLGPCDTMWEDSHNKEHEMRPRVSEEESEGERSVIPTTLYLQTDDFEGDDHLDEVPSMDVTMNEIRPTASSRRSLASPATVRPQNNTTSSKASDLDTCRKKFQQLLCIGKEKMDKVLWSVSDSHMHEHH